MNDNEIFLAKWKPIHEKTIAKFVIRYSLIYFLITALMTITFLWIYPSISINNRNRPLSENDITLVILLFTMTFLISTVSRLITWHSGEKRYTKLINREL